MGGVTWDGAHLATVLPDTSWRRWTWLSWGPKGLWKVVESSTRWRLFKFSPLWFYLVPIQGSRWTCHLGPPVGLAVPVAQLILPSWGDFRGPYKVVGQLKLSRCPCPSDVPGFQRARDCLCCSWLHSTHIVLWCLMHSVEFGMWDCRC